MEKDGMEREGIESRLKAMEEDLAFIKEEMIRARERRQEARELKEDLSRIAKDAFDTAVVELEEVAPFVETGDFLHLGKKILRNVRNLSRLFERLEGAVDFFEDFKPLGKEIFGDVLAKLDEMEKKGYFVLLAGMAGILDAAASQFTPERLETLARALPELAALLEEAAEGGALKDMRRALAAWNEGRKGKPRSLLGVLVGIRSPAVRRSMTGWLNALEAMGEENENP